MEQNPTYTYIKLESGNTPQLSREGLKLCRISSSISPFTFIKLFAAADNKINPRVAKENQITQDIRATLATEPEIFWLKSKGIVVATQNCKLSDRNRVGITLSEDIDREGIMDGGHNTLAVAQFLLVNLFPENKLIKDWAGMKEFWAENTDEIVERFNKNVESGMFNFSIPIEIIFPSDDEGAFEEYLEFINSICDGRNANVQLRDSAKDNQVGIYDGFKDLIACKKDVIWKTGMPGKIKVENVVSIASLLFISLQEKSLLPPSISTLNPVSIYSGSGKCVDFFGEVIRHQDVSVKDGDKYVITNPRVKSAMSMIDDLLKFYDKMYLNFPAIYQRTPGKFGGIKAVEMKSSKCPFGYFEEVIDYKYPNGFFIPLFCGVRELITYNETTDTISWIINPATINFDDLDCETYVEMIKFLNFNPQSVGKAAMMYKNGVNTFNAYKNAVLNR